MADEPKSDLEKAARELQDLANKPDASMSDVSKALQGVNMAEISSSIETLMQLPAQMLKAFQAIAALNTTTKQQAEKINSLEINLNGLRSSAAKQNIELGNQILQLETQIGQLKQQLNSHKHG